MNKLLIINSSVKIQTIHSLVKKHNIKEWVPLVSSFEEVDKIANAIAKIASKKDISLELQETADEIRRPYYQITAEIGQKYNSLAWWANRISERNTMHHKLFLHCCYVVLVKEIIEKGGSLCIICESNSLMDNVMMLAKELRYKVVVKKSKFDYKNTVFWAFCAGVYRVLRSLIIYVLAKTHKLYFKKYRLLTENPDIILHTWVDEKCFGNNNDFKDRYFTVLPEYYREKGYKLSTIVTIYNIKRSYFEALTFFRTSKDSFIIPEDYYRLIDYFFPFLLWIKKFKFKFESLKFKGVDCSPLFRFSNKVEPIDFTTMYFLLFKRLAQHGMVPKILVDGFENMVSDKMIQLGVRKFMPNTLIYGFFHTVPSLNVLCFSTDIHERGFAPLPDRIICNGQKFKDVLIQGHYPAEKIMVGAALRYLYLYEMSKENKFISAKDFRILLTLPLEREAALEVFHKLIGATSGIDRYRLIIKPHPMGTAILDELKKYFPQGTEVDERNMGEVILQCHIVVSAATGAVFDCLMADKEVIRVGPNTQINVDPIAWFEEFGCTVFGIKQLRQAIFRLEEKMKLKYYVPPNYSSMLPEFFSPADESTLAAFLPAN